MANCLVCHITARSYQSRDDGLTFHRFPASRTVICSKWKEFAGLAEDYDVKSKRLCSRHFRPDDFVHKSPFRKNLRCGAVPTLCHPSKRSCTESSETAPTSAPLEDVLSGSEDPSRNDCTLDSALSEASESNNALILQNNDALASFVVDIPTMDHDYIATTNVRELPPQVGPKKNQEELSSRLLLDNVRKELCRLCGQKSTMLAPIFVMPFLSDNVSMAMKIEMHLPFKVIKGDPLPTHICLNCSDLVNRWHELYMTCVAANAVLWKTFGEECNEESSNDLEESMISVMENEISEIVEVECEPLLSVPLISEDPQEKNDDTCSECKKRKTDLEITEEKSLNEEFEKNFLTVRDYSYKCRFCYELFNDTNDRKDHLSVCRQLPTICELCGQEILFRKDLRRHILLRHIKKSVTRIYVCDQCEKVFKSASSMKNHRISHERPKASPKHYCELCCKVFLNEKYFLRHKEQHAEGKIKSLFQVNSFQQGESSEDIENIKIYSCPVCQEVFNDMLSLVVHLTTKRAMKCASCHKSIPCEKKFLLHVCGEWTCQQCPKTFNNKQKFIEHERIHTGEKPIKCRFCEKTFRTWPARKLHENRHNPNLKTVFQCSSCPKTFTNKYKFQDHVACHEGKVFSCDICDKNFSGRKNLWKHRRLLHKIAKETSS